jgi:serine/threonine-protein kinase
VTNRVVWAERYAVFDEIASGGMASVFLACRLGASDTPRVVAIKKLFEQFAKRPEFVTMFLDEAHLAARIKHPNVVATYDFLRIPDSLAIVMEFVLGVSLDDLMTIGRDRGEAPSIPVATAILHGALEGLHAAHEAKDDQGKDYGLVHRDVSPHNIIVGKDGTPRVIDFGIAKAAGRLHVTDVGVIKGKYAYMAPEQLRGGKVDRRTDVYASGVVLWETLAGRSLFDAEVNAELLGQRAAGNVPVPAPRSLNAAVSSELEAIVLRAVEVDPARRFATAHEMAQALESTGDIASPDEIALWVQKLARSRLSELEAKRNEVETAYAAGELADLVPGAASTPTAAPPARPAPDLVSTGSAAAPPARSAPVADIPDLVSTGSAAGRPAARPPAQPAASKPKVGLPAAPSFDEPFDEPDMQEMKLDLAVPLAESMAVRAPVASSSLDARTLTSAEASGPSHRARGSSRSRRGRGALVFLVLLVATGALGVRFVPPFLKSAIVAAAARRGFVLSIDGVEPQGGGLALSGVTLGLAGVSDVSMKAREVDLGFDWQGNLQKVLVPGFELSLRGDPTDVAGHFASWRSAPHLPFAFEASAGHLVWTDVVPQVVQAEGIDVSLGLGGRGEGSVHLDASSLVVKVPRGSLGPWRGALDSTADETKVVIALDRSRPDGSPNVTFVTRPTLGKMLSATIPRTRSSVVGIPADLLRAGPDPEFDLAVEGQVMPTGEPLTAHAALSLFASPRSTGGSGATPVDIVFEGSVAGDSTHPLGIDPGSITVGKVKSRLNGTVTFPRGGVCIEVDRPSAKTPRPQAPFVLDTREWLAPPEAAGASKAAPTPPPTASAPAPPPTASAPVKPPKSGGASKRR